MTATEKSSTGSIGPVIAATSFGFVVTQLDVTIVNVALPRIASSLSVHVAGLQWVVDAYTLPFAVLMLSAGVLGDRFGSRRAYLAGLIFFVAASLACGLAPNAAILVAARGLQGVAAALLIPSSLALLSHAAAADHSLRAKAVGFWTAAGSVAIASGPVIGGLLLASFGWRSIFLVNLPLCLLGAWLTVRSIVPDESSAGSPGENRDQNFDKNLDKNSDRLVAKQHLDPWGQILAIVSLASLTCAVIEFRPLGIAHPLVVGSAAAAVLAGFAFYIAESRSREPMVPLGMFRLPNFSPSMVFGAIVNLTYYGMIFVLSLYLQQVRGYSAVQTGLAYLPLTATFIFSNIASGLAASRVGPRLPMILGSLLTALGYLLLARLGPATPYWAMLPPFVIIPSGMGFAVPAMTATVLSGVDRKRSGTASAILNAVRQTGGAIGVAIFGAMVEGETERIAHGLRMASIMSVVLLLIAAGVAWRSIRQNPNFTYDPELVAEGSAD